MIYLFICFLIIIFGYLEIIKNDRTVVTLYGIFISLIMVFFAAIRYKVGTDWPAYYDFYHYGATGTEIGYRFFNDSFSKLGAPYNLFLLIINALSLTLICFSLRKYAGFLIFPILLFYSELFLYFNFSGIRQGLAISFTVFSIKYIINRNFVKFLMTVALASCFHITAIIFVIAYFIPFRKFNKKEYLVLIGGFFLFSTLIFSVINIFSGDLAQKAKFYLELQEQETDIKSLFLVGAIKRSIIIFLILFFKKGMLKDKNSIFFFNTYLIGFGMYLTTYLISPDIGVRLSSYFLIFDLFLAGNLLLQNKKLSTRLLIGTIFSMVAIYKITTYMAQETFNYHTIFSN